MRTAAEPSVGKSFGERHEGSFFGKDPSILLFSCPLFAKLYDAGGEPAVKVKVIGLGSPSRVPDLARIPELRIVGRTGPQDCPPRARLDCETANDLSDLFALSQTMRESMSHAG